MEFAQHGMTMKFFQILALVLISEVKFSHAKVEPLPYLPPELQVSLDTCRSTGDLSKQSGQLVFWTSIQQYVSKFTEYDLNLTIPERKLFESTMYEIVKPLLHYSPTGRHKRQAQPPRIRREIRATSASERRRYFDALNAMKRDRRLTPNVYDVLARIHSGINIRRSHMGTAFPSWHRMYLYILESVLRIWYDPGVTIPYWESARDSNMMFPTQSAIWSDEFFGGGFGVVSSGPFANWGIRRNIGNGNLMTTAGERTILSRRLNEEILFPTANPTSNLEGMHGGPHSFVGGTMGQLNQAAFDPVFFSHHAYVDYIWQQFRDLQRTAGINPETDYPYNANDPRYRPEHHPNENAGFISIDNLSVIGTNFAALTQGVGYSTVFDEMIQYEDTPECPDCDFSPFLYCDTSINECVPRTIDEMGGLGGNQQTTPQGSSTSSQGPSTTQRGPSTTPETTVGKTQTTRFPTTHSGVTSNPGTSPRKHSAHYTGGSCGRQPFINDVDTKYMGSSGSGSGSGDWAYIPVNVVSKRPDTIKGYNEYSLFKQKAKWANETILGYKYEFTRAGWQQEYEGCSKKQGVVGKISVVSWGINYDGYAEEYIVVDNRIGVSQGNGFLPVKKPTKNNPSEFIVTAYDSCGRVCKPYCNSKSHGQINDNFGGGFKATIDSPHQYSNSYEEAMLSMWEMTSASFSPVIDYGDIPITFFCEYTDKWLWDKPLPPPTKTPTKTKPTHQTTKPTTLQTTRQPGTTTYGQMNKNYGLGFVIPKQPVVPYGVTNDQTCVVATDCIIDTPCRGCTDFDYEYCRGGQKIAICIYGLYSTTATTEAHFKHFYKK